MGAYNFFPGAAFGRAKKFTIERRLSQSCFHMRSRSLSSSAVAAAPIKSTGAICAPLVAALLTGAAAIICPGGGYGGLVMGAEGSGIAKWLNAHGITGIVLQYRLPKGRPFVPLLDVQRAIRTVRSKARDWGCDPQRIGIIGFSAGGHLASTAATHFDGGNAKASDPIERHGCRPNFAVLVYPVITMGEKTHGGSKRNLLGAAPAPETIALFSNEKQVTAQTPPTFLLHTSEDRVVPPQNSIVFYMALLKAGVPAELHIYEKGPHGVGLAKKRPGISGWPASCQAWLGERGFLKKKR